MKATGIICEYNPFHNGHLYHINETKRLCKSDYMIGVMSGDFTQRGTPAIVGKYSRTRMALLGGLDVVIELPVRYATASAEGFACAAVNILEHTGICDNICFGTEHGDLDSMLEIAAILADEPASYRDMLGSYLKNGEPFPLAREHALTEYMGKEPGFSFDPNNILGLEYLKACMNTGITPYTVKRSDHGYHADDSVYINCQRGIDPDNFADTPQKDHGGNIPSEYSSDTSLMSAEAIRNIILAHERKEKGSYNTLTDNTLTNISPYVPSYTSELLNNVTDPEDYSRIIYYSLLKNADHLEDYADMSREIADRIRSNLSRFDGLDSFIKLIKTRNYTYTRIARAILHCLLGIKKTASDQTSLQSLSGQKYPIPYIRILGFKKESSDIMKLINNNATVPVITQPAKNIVLDPFGKDMLNEDITSSELYNHMRFIGKNTDSTTVVHNEYTHGIVIL